MQGRQQRRWALKLVVLVAIVRLSSPCFSEEPAHVDEFFAIGERQTIDTPTPLFVMDGGNEKVGANVLALASTATSASPAPQYQPGIGAPRNYPGRSPFETPGSGFFKTMGVGMFAAAAGDLATTELGLRSPEIVEMNPMQRNRGVRIATHIAVPALLFWATERASKSGNRKLALLIRIGASVAYSYAAMHNARTLAYHP